MQLHTFTATVAANSTYKYTLNLALPSSGIHALKLKVDEDNTPSVFSKDFYWAAKMGKAVEFNVTPNQSSPHIVERGVPFNISIRNVWTQSTGILSLRVFDNNITIGDVDLINLSPGYIASFTLELTVYTPGSHTIRFVLDPDRVNLPDYYAKSYTGT